MVQYNISCSAIVRFCILLLVIRHESHAFTSNRLAFSTGAKTEQQQQQQPINGIIPLIRARNSYVPNSSKKYLVESSSSSTSRAASNRRPDQYATKRSVRTTALYQLKQQQQQRGKDSKSLPSSHGHERTVLVKESSVEQGFTSLSWLTGPDGSITATWPNAVQETIQSRIVLPMSGAVTTVVAYVMMTSMSSYHTTKAVTTSAIDVTRSFVQKFWWTFPLALCLAPAFFQTVLRQTITTPHFWKMVNMEYILHCPDAAFVISCFLGSNIAYFLAGGFLLHRFPARSLQPGLGWWILSSGLISTIFHTVQAIGDHALAEGLCYVDHGIAGAAVLYYWNVCGFPPSSKRFWALALLGLAALSCPIKPGYAWLHSTWHFLSAGAAIVWAMEGKLQRKQRLFHKIRQYRQLGTPSQRNETGSIVGRTDPLLSL